MEAELAAEDRTVEDVIVIDYRMHDRKLALHVDRRQPVKVLRACVKVAAVAATGEIDLGQRIIGGDVDAD